MDMTPWTLTRLERAVENFSAQLQCAICLCAYDSPVSLPCNHCFCEECIHRALELKALCPICKTPAKKRRLRYDTTVQKLLRATEMLCAAPAMKTEDEGDVEDRKTSKVAGAKVAVPLMSPRRGKRNLKTKSPTLMDVWMSNGHSQVDDGLKIKQEKVSTPRKRPRLMQEEINSAMSPAIFDITVMSRSKSDGEGGRIGTLCAIENGTQLEDAESTNVVAKNDDAAKIEVETVGQEEQMLSRRRRSLADGEVTILDGSHVESEQKRRVQSTATQAPIANVEVGQLMLQTTTPRKRRRHTTNGVTLDAAASKTLKEVAVANGSSAITNRGAHTSSLGVDSQMQPVESEAFQVGDVVEVIERQWVGINKQGGAARIIKVHGDGFFAVKFVIGGKDNRVPGSFICRPAEELISDSTPSRSVKKRQRRSVSDKMMTPDGLATKTTGSTDRMNKVKPKTKKKHSGMVFLCSGFKEQRMQQIEEWADLLGAEVVQNWSNDVTHLIVDCVSKGDAENEDPSMDDSDSTSLPQSHRNGKRGLISDPKSGRWVKIRSLKYLKALVGGRWIVSDEWLQACAEHGGYVKEVNYEADGHWKGRRIHDAVKRSRLRREKLLQLSPPDVDRSSVGTMLFAAFCFHIIGEFLPPMPSATELETLICMGGGKLIATISDETYMREKRARKLIIVSDKINPITLRQQTKQLKAQPKMKAISSAIIVNYLWVINSISEANLRELPLL